MARWILQNTIIFKTRRLNEGKVIDDAQYDVAQIRLAGGQLTAFGNAEAKKQSDVAIAQQKRGTIVNLASVAAQRGGGLVGGPRT